MKKMLKIGMLALVVVLLATLISNAQGGWERNYTLMPVTSSNFYRVVHSSDGGYCALAPWDFDTTRIHLLKTDADGTAQWEVSLPAGDSMNSTSLYTAGDGGYLLTRGTQKQWITQPFYQASLLKFGSNGNLLWRKNHKLDQSAAIWSVKELQGGQIMGVGEVYKSNGRQGLILRMDALGNLLDTANISLPAGQVTLYDFFEKSDGSFLLSGKYISNNFTLIYEFWMHLDKQLNVLETKNQANNSFNSGARFSSDGHLFVGSIDPSSLKMTKLDINGLTLWEKSFSSGWGVVSFGQSSITIDGSPDGGCVFALGDLTYAIVKLDEDGNETWHRTLSTFNGPIKKVSSIRSTSDNGCIACGYQSDAPTYKAYLVKIGENGLVYPNLVSGRVVSDTEQDCSNGPGDLPLQYRIIKASSVSENFYAVPNSDGNYKIDLPPGTYLVHSKPIHSGALQAYCEDSVTVNLPNVGDNALVDFTDTLPQCPRMRVNLGTQIIRPCFSGFYYGELLNMGTDTAFNAHVIVTLDHLLSYTNSSPAATSVNGQNIRLDFGDIPSGGHRTFQVKFFTDCNAPLGYTHCTEAHAYPDTSCIPVSGLWGGASLVANAVCNGDSVFFNVQNVGQGTMTEQAAFVIIEDDMIQRQALTPILDPGEAVKYSIAADGSTYRIEVAQEPHHPSMAQPSAVVQGCNAGVFATGFVNLFSTPDDDPWIDIFCRMNTNAFDPNSKEALPLGYGAPNFIEANTALEYILHFQNTGTAEAINVVLKDTIEETLDLFSIEPGASSHAYTWSVTGKGVLTFRFDNIFLPDSNTNEPGSKGFVTFRIRQKLNLPLGTLIQNKAAIYFDFNAPIITNTTKHTIGKDFLPVVTPVSTQAPSAAYQWLVSPNPAQGQLRFSHKDIPTNLFPLSVTLTDMLGRTVHQGIITTRNHVLNRENWSSGCYFYQIKTESGALMGEGKVLWGDF